MKIEVTWEDYNDIIMAIAVAKASSGLRFGHDYEMLRDRIVTAWGNAEEEEILTRNCPGKKQNKPGNLGDCQPTERWP